MTTKFKSLMTLRPDSALDVFNPHKAFVKGQIVTNSVLKKQVQTGLERLGQVWKDLNTNKKVWKGLNMFRQA